MLPGEKLDCGCGAPDCRGIVAPGQASAIRATLAEATAHASACIAAVEQPLWLLLPEETRRQLRAVANGERGWPIRDVDAEAPPRRAAARRR